MVTTTRSDTERAHRQLALQAFASLAAPQSALDAEIYAQDVRFHGPASAIWGARTGQGEAMSIFATPCLDIARMDMQNDRVLSHVTLHRRPELGANHESAASQGPAAQGLIVHRFESGRIAEVWSVLRWS